ncbi:MAG: hypothetical protein U9R74_01670 [Pseudomonadota bacterium]|nr:hypothetical protein [Pseudomonadota bacterium]
MKHSVHIAIAIAASVIIAGCASTPKEEKKTTQISSLPDWVSNPTIADGIASSECVPWSGDMSLDRAEAVAKARADLAKQIDIKVKAMDKTYGRKTKTAAGVSSGGVFETVSKQVTQRNLSATQVIKVDIVDVNKVDHLCAMVAFGSAASKKIFEDIVSSSSVAQQISPQDESVLWEEFKAHKSQQELEAETR